VGGSGGQNADPGGGVTVPGADGGELSGGLVLGAGEVERGVTGLDLVGEDSTAAVTPQDVRPCGRDERFGR
jgi:hypothetical protein